MDRAEHIKQAQAVGDSLDGWLREVTDKYDAGTILSIMLGRSIALCKMLRESGGGFDREAAITYFGTALAEAAAPMVAESDAELSESSAH